MVFLGASQDIIANGAFLQRGTGNLFVFMCVSVNFYSAIGTFFEITVYSLVSVKWGAAGSCFSAIGADFFQASVLIYIVMGAKTG